VQPFDLCGRLDLGFSRVSSAKCSALNARKGTVLDVQLFYNFPGLAWAYSRPWLTHQGGLYDGAVNGGGDALNAAAVGGYSVCHPRRDGTHDQKCVGNMGGVLLPAYAPTYEAYEARALQRPARVAFAEGVVALHAWHGSDRKRQYSSRKANMDGVADVLDVVREDSQGIFEFRPGEVPRRINDSLCRYFIDRHDDDISHTQG